jgi:hypothetical protein
LFFVLDRLSLNERIMGEGNELWATINLVDWIAARKPFIKEGSRGEERWVGYRNVTFIAGLLLIILREIWVRDSG